MNREDFFQRAMLMMAAKIMERTDKEPSPAQLALKAKEYAAGLTEEMLVGLAELDISEEAAGRPTAPPAPREKARADVPVLGPSSLPDPAVPCPSCDAPMRRRRSRHGEFWGCSKFPACTGTRSGDFGS